jgi:hypothetical protein
LFQLLLVRLGLDFHGGSPPATRLVCNYPLVGLHSVDNLERSDRELSTSPGRDLLDRPLLDGDNLLLGCRESELGDSDLGIVLESLVPSIKEVQSPINLPIYRGRSVYHRPEPDGGSGSSGTLVGATGKEYTWSKGLGMETSPIKTRSARKKKEASRLISEGSHLSVINEFGALRGLKALARAKT